MARTRIGHLDKRVTLQRATVGDAGGGSGHARTDWANFASVPTVWAKLEPLDGDEFNEQGQLQPRRQWRVTIRRRQDVTTKDRLLYGSKELYIRATGDDHLRSEFMELTCSESPS